MNNTHVATTERQLHNFFVKYNTTKWKMHIARGSGNDTMANQYERDLKIMRQSISILGIHINEINR